MRQSAFLFIGLVLVVLMGLLLSKPMNNIESTGLGHALLADSDMDKTKEKPSRSTTPFEALDPKMDLESGLRSADEMTREWIYLSGDTKGVEWGNEQIDGHYTLSSILTHYQNLSGSPQDILFIHVLGNKNRKEEAVTFFNRELNEAEEKSAKASMILPRHLEFGETSTEDLSEPLPLSLYKFSVEERRFARAFDLRSPRGTSRSRAAQANDFNPLDIITPENFTDGYYHSEIEWMGQTYDIQIAVRKTELETLTIEVRTKEIGTLSIKSFLLIYEEVTG